MDLNVKYKTIKPLGENIEDLKLSEEILDMISKAQSTHIHTHPHTHKA